MSFNTQNIATFNYNNTDNNSFINNEGFGKGLLNRMHEIQKSVISKKV